jgi:glycosyltransferase involved in cell wall biosynthesis
VLQVNYDINSFDFKIVCTRYIGYESGSNSDGHIEIVRIVMIDILVVGHAPVLQINRLLYRRLMTRGFSIEIAIPNRLPLANSATVEPRSEDDPPLHHLEVKGTDLRHWLFDGLETLCQQRQPRLVLIENEPDTAIVRQCARWTRYNRAKIACMSVENDMGSPLAAVFRGEHRRALRSARSWLAAWSAGKIVDYVFTISNDGIKSMNFLGWGDRVTQVPLGFDETLFFPSPHTRIEMRNQLRLNELTFGFFGRLHPAKALDLLIAALAGMLDLNWQLLIDRFESSASGYESSVEQVLHESGVFERTIWFHATHKEMPRYMNAADVVVAPSVLKEQYGRVVPEAMACNCVPVISDSGAMPELVGDTGLIVPRGNLDALKGALRSLAMAPDLLTKLRLKAAMRSAHLLSLRQQVDLMEPVLRTLLR